MENQKLFVVNSAKTDEAAKCGGCNWEVSQLYAIARSQEDADKLFKSGDAGLCGDCLCDLLVEGGYKIWGSNI